MYWIASYPRSGNTFLRILFREVYGLYTWEGYAKESPTKVLNNKTKRTVTDPIIIKTHELPDNTEVPHHRFKTIYLVRDGRDAAVSMAHHRRQFIKPGSRFLSNLMVIVAAPFGSSYGGWSNHVKQWSKHSDLVIKFEDLISDPVPELKKIENLMGLPTGNYAKIPTFNDLKTKTFLVGSGNNNQSKQQQQKHRDKFFRSGKTKDWKNRMPKIVQDYFELKHGTQLSKLGYINNRFTPNNYVKITKFYLYWFISLFKIGKEK